MYQAHEIMNVNVVTIHPEASVDDAVRTLVERNVSEAPIVDDNGKLVGIISEFPLLEVIYTPSVRELPVSRLMSKDVLTVRENTLLSDVATLFVVNRIRRVPVVRDGRVVGIISHRDLLRYILDMGGRLDELLKDVCGVAGA